MSGESGFLGALLVARLLERGNDVVSVDLVPSHITHPCLKSIVDDIRDRALLDRELNTRKFDAVFHCAALLAHGNISSKELWSSNVEGTETLAQAVKFARVPVLVYTSGENHTRAIFKMHWGEHVNRTS